MSSHYYNLATVIFYLVFQGALLAPSPGHYPLHYPLHNYTLKRSSEKDLCGQLLHHWAVFRTERNQESTGERYSRRGENVLYDEVKEQVSDQRKSVTSANL